MSPALHWTLALLAVAALALVASGLVKLWRWVRPILAVVDGFTRAHENAPNHPGEM